MRIRTRDPLAERIAARRRRRVIVTALLVIATGVLAGYLVIKSHGPAPAQVNTDAE